jgi:excisionase family DNA binding protein
MSDEVQTDWPILYTVAEVARILRVTSQAIQAQIRAGTITAIKPGRRYLITEQTLRDLLRPAPSTKGPSA